MNITFKGTLKKIYRKINKICRRTKKHKRVNVIYILAFASVFCAVFIIAAKIKNNTAAAANYNIVTQEEKSKMYNSSVQSKQGKKSEKSTDGDAANVDSFNVNGDKDIRKISKIDRKELTTAEKEDPHPLLLQKDARWKNDPYGKGTVGMSGCAPTCLSMAVVTLKHDYYATPPRVASFSEKEGYYIAGQGTSNELIRIGCEHYGLKCVQIADTEEAIENALDDGDFLVLSLTHGHFTDTPSGHYITIYGYGDDGLYINDPNSRANSKKVWKLETFSSEIMGIYALSVQD